jgi:hypothetical protein
VGQGLRQPRAHARGGSPRGQPARFVDLSAIAGHKSTQLHRRPRRCSRWAGARSWAEGDRAEMSGASSRVEAGACNGDPAAATNRPGRGCSVAWKEQRCVSVASARASVARDSRTAQRLLSAWRRRDDSRPMAASPDPNWSAAAGRMQGGSPTRWGAAVATRAGLRATGRDEQRLLPGVARVGRIRA